MSMQLSASAEALLILSAGKVRLEGQFPNSGANPLNGLSATSRFDQKGYRNLFQCICGEDGFFPILSTFEDNLDVRSPGILEFSGVQKSPI